MYLIDSRIMIIYVLSKRGLYFTLVPRFYHVLRYIKPGMTVPILSKSTQSFSVWEMQLNAFFALKGKETEEEKLSILPACIDEELLVNLLIILKKRSTSYSSVMQKAKEVWLTGKRPSNPEKQFVNIRIDQPSQAVSAHEEMKWLSEYLGYDNTVIVERIKNAVSDALRPTVFLYANSKKGIVSDELVQFISTIPDANTGSGNEVLAVSMVCRYCKKHGHEIATCPVKPDRTKITCFACGEVGHIKKNCRKSNYSKN